MSIPIYYKSYSAPDVNKKELQRFALCSAEMDAESEKLIDSCISELLQELCYKVCYAYFPIALDKDELDLGFARVKSSSLAKNLTGCSHIVLFAATVGLAPDRLTARYRGTSPAKSLFFDAIGAERVEALCDAFCTEIRAEESARGRFTRPRFSPGYGDLPLELQRDIFRALSPERHIGASLRESLIVSPAKTVTAIVGIEKNN